MLYGIIHKPGSDKRWSRSIIRSYKKVSEQVKKEFEV